jgi:hypothetical protein
VEPKIQVFFCLKTQYNISDLSYRKTNAHEKEKKEMTEAAQLSNTTIQGVMQ